LFFGQGKGGSSGCHGGLTFARADQILDGIKQAGGNFFRINLKFTVGNGGLDVGDFLGVETAVAADLGAQRLIWVDNCTLDEAGVLALGVLALAAPGLFCAEASCSGNPAPFLRASLTFTASSLSGWGWFSTPVAKIIGHCDANFNLFIVTLA